MCIRDRDAARRELLEHAVPPEAIERTWMRFSAPYFLRHTAAEVAWHTRLLAQRGAHTDEPVSYTHLDVYKRQ